uniref:Maintenance of Photosystem II under High light 2 C-terminal domain-containing protein n=1 Tax=Tetradesmus obliquus TaxID=3088 RepID=A0A383WCK5_TETOB|eukprot:jgi/Sobl393_1/70/SZX74809.1
MSFALAQQAGSRALSGAFRPSRPHARSIVCNSAKADADAVNRRSALTAGLVAMGALVAAPAPKAWALIPDEEDEELLERAKANRKQRLAAQKETTRNFLKEEGVKDKQLDAELLPVQKAVFQLAKSGSQLEAGDLKGLSANLGSGWVGEFQRATSVLDASDAEKAKAAAVFDGISSLRDVANKGDLRGSKQQYVALVAALNDWASSTGLAADLKGL